MVLYKLIMDLHEEKLVEKQVLVHLLNCHLPRNGPFCGLRCFKQCLIMLLGRGQKW